MPRAVGLLTWLKDSLVASNEPAWADIPRGLLGMTRVLHELATGQNPVDGDPPASAPNAQGLLGVDLSGPPYGSAPVHTIASIESFNGSSANVQAYAATSKSVATVPAGGTTRLTSRTRGSVYSQSLDLAALPWTFWVRPHAAQADGAPYSRGYLSITARRVSGSGAITLEARASVTAREERVRTSGTFAVSTSSETTTNDVMWLDLVPGLNSWWIQLENPGAVDVEITRVALYQKVKRRHTL